jgi:integrase
MASASITRRETKAGPRFHVRYRLGGRYTPVQHGGSFPTLREARIRRDWIGGELAAGRVPDLSLIPEKRETLAQVAERWRASRVDITDTTSDVYRRHIARITPTLGHLEPSRITVAHVQEWTAAQSAELKPGSLRNYLGTLKQILDHAGLNPNPARSRQVKLPRAETTIVEPPTGEQVAAIIGHSPKRWRLALRTLEQTGMRIGEAVELEWRDVDVRGSRFRIRRGKTATARRWVAVPPWVMDEIAGSCPPDDRTPKRQVFMGLTRHVAQGAMERACRAAGIATYSPHDLRHRYASIKLAEGVPVTDLAAQLGHSKKSLTLDVYTHVLIDEGR